MRENEPDSETYSFFWHDPADVLLNGSKAFSVIGGRDLQVFYKESAHIVYIHQTTFKGNRF